ncbi:UV-endonuclease UVE-1 [Metarhizium album ARSEF 1941]|uniref:UV-endonuclease UVE-1 n=1 Tax=Metarhizium album (strain ARSEF 1941) TaxID=1081103 RepID=A0A0B2WG21_METAS|nr:UV-endonuclease UVE-1 [Metarhizium album ARSEF 1941]KHN94931.1 UV-endonuclease UVE-1 [Metarhizium album ARSEF 1941]
MPLKRKHSETHTTLPRAEAPRRRSTRRVKDEDGAQVGINQSRTKSADGLSSKENVERAMHNLWEMDNKLLDEAKRQRLAIEASNLEALAAKEDEAYGGRDVTKGSTEYMDTVAQSTGTTQGLRNESEVECAEEAPLLENEACLNTYLRTATPPVFSSRTCRISSILEHRHSLQDPTQPEHPTKNRPDKSQPADPNRGLKYVQEIGLNNARDIVKMLRWNDKYGIKFMRLSSEMFPFASHAEYGYRLAYASEVLAAAGKVASELGHRVTTHPGQFTQIGSPKRDVIAASVRDLEYHNEMLSRLCLSKQLDRDAVMVLHMGGVYGDKQATLGRFRENYHKLSEGVKRRLVLENDDVSWSVHDLLPICEELNIPLVLDFHHHNIIFDPSVREGTLDIISLYERIKATWTRKNITQKMHYSEPVASAVTPRDRRKHSARVKTLPPCATDMDLMIEAKDKEQAVFELMRTFKLPGWDLFNDIVPHERTDEPKREATRKTKRTVNGKSQVDGTTDTENEAAEDTLSADDVSMGGPDRRVYWPEGMEEWLKPKKREFKTGTKNGRDK